MSTSANIHGVQRLSILERKLHIEGNEHPFWTIKVTAIGENGESDSFTFMFDDNAGPHLVNANTGNTMLYELVDWNGQVWASGTSYHLATIDKVKLEAREDRAMHVRVTETANKVSIPNLTYQLESSEF